MVRSNVWSVARLNQDIRLCERVNIEVPEVQIRSWAYHLAPIGIGTPNTESLTSYFARLAEAHCVTPWALFTHRMPGFNKKSNNGRYGCAVGLVSPTETRATSQINGSGLSAEKWVAMIEELTLQNNLRFLTFLYWRNILSNRIMVRANRAWCPACFEDQRVASRLIYEQLFWIHRIVQVCPNHKISLETKCQHCKSSSAVLCGSSRPGICPRCNSWLGHYSKLSRSIFDQIGFLEASFEVFVAEQIGELVANAPKLVYSTKQELPKISLTKCADLFFDGNLCALTRFFGANKGAVSSLWNGRPRTTNLELLLRVAFRAGVALLDLFMDENALSGFSPFSSTIAVNNRLSPRRKKEDVLKVLLAAVKESPPPSLREMAERLGYSSVRTLRRYFPLVCDQIKANYMESARGKVRKFSTSRLQEDKVIKAALEAALKEEPSPSLEHVAKTLGYTSSQAIRVRFREICKALADKRRNLISERRDRIDGQLKLALSSDPPISLETVSESLGYRTTTTLRTEYTELCREIRLRYEEHMRRQRLSKIECELRSILIESPPPPLNAALRRIGVSDRSLRKYFPEEHRSISTRYLKFRKSQSMKNKMRDKNRIRLIVADLTKRGIFPSMNAVLKRFSASYLKRPEVWATIRQAREEFPSPV